MINDLPKDIVNAHVLNEFSPAELARIACVSKKTQFFIRHNKNFTEYKEAYHNKEKAVATLWDKSNESSLTGKQIFNLLKRHSLYNLKGLPEATHKKLTSTMIHELEKDLTSLEQKKACYGTRYNLNW